MKITRRSFVTAATSAVLFPSEWMALAQQQGIASRGVKPQARPPASGRPFNAHFVNLAHEAGLRIPTIYGGIDKKKYILEANGCGCAFIDYDNDGWIDIFLLCGTRLEADPPEATNRLYKNNRDGTFSDVTDKAGLRAVGWANGVCIGDYNNDGFEDIFCTYYGENRI
jgi:enediyne biosynthesis protein E4